MTRQPPSSSLRALWLRVTAKLLTAGGVLFLLAAFTAGLFSGTGEAPESMTVELQGLMPGEFVTVEWERRQVLVLHRSEQMLASLDDASSSVADAASRRSRQPAGAVNAHRSLTPEYFVVIAHEPELGCPVEYMRPGINAPVDPAWQGGFRDRCRGSWFDAAGRVYRDMRTDRNLAVPPHRYRTPTQLVIGENP